MPELTPIPGRLLVIVGARPEPVKLAPLVLEARTRAGLGPMVVATGGLRLVGTDPVTISREAGRLLDSPAARMAMSCAGMPFGDGHAARRIVDCLVNSSTRSTRLRPGAALSEPPRWPVATTRRPEGVSL
jgi:UDP-N-acetylglucosamine 2-epimerase